MSASVPNNEKQMFWYSFCNEWPPFVLFVDFKKIAVEKITSDLDVVSKSLIFSSTFSSGMKTHLRDVV